MTSTDCADQQSMLTQGPWLWCLIITCWLSAAGSVVNGSLLFFFVLRLKSSHSSCKSFLLTLFVGQIILTCLVAPFRISQIARAAYSCEGMPEMNSFIQALSLIPRVTNGIIAYDRYLRAYHKETYNMKGGRYYLLLCLPWMFVVVDMLAVVFGDIVDNVVSLVIALLLITCATVCNIRLKKGNRNRIQDHLLKDHVLQRSNTKLRYLCTYIIVVQYICAVYGILKLSFEAVSAASQAPWEFWASNKQLYKELYLLFLLLAANLNPIIHFYKEKSFKKLSITRRVSQWRNRKPGCWHRSSICSV